jgi:hypothetical protein
MLSLVVNRAEVGLALAAGEVAISSSNLLSR